VARGRLPGSLSGTTRIVKTVAFIIVGLLAGSTGSPSQAAEKKYVGRAVVVGLGNITFPTGEWSLEFQHMQAPTNGLHLPDYFVFKRGGDRIERLTFLRYAPTTTPRQLAHMLDTVGETMGDGIPWEEKTQEGRPPGVIHPMRTIPGSPTLTELKIEYSFILVRPGPAPSWLCHSILFHQGHSTFVIAHASTSAIDPEVAEDVQFRSQFFPITKPARNEK